MRQITLLISTMLIGGALSAQGQGLGALIRTPDRSVPVVNQALEGTWLYELRRGGQPETQPPVLLLIQFHADGTIVASPGDGTQSSHHGTWLRVGDKKFVLTTFTFSFNEARALTTILKIRANVQLSADGASARGTQEIVLMNRDGAVLATVPGGTFTGTRLTAEIAGDFADFLNRP